MTVGLSAVEVRVPRLSDVLQEVSPNGFSSCIVRRCEPSSRQTQELFRKLYMEGLSAGDFESVFKELVGEMSRAALVPRKPKSGVSAGAIMYLSGGSIAGRRCRSSAIPSA